MVVGQPIVGIDELDVFSRGQSQPLVEGVADAAVLFADPVILRAKASLDQLDRTVGRTAVDDDVLEVGEGLPLDAGDRSIERGASVEADGDETDLRPGSAAVAGWLRFPTDRTSTRLNTSHSCVTPMPYSA